MEFKHDRNVARKIIVATIAGNAFAFYDFAVYSFFAVYIGRSFFPAADPLSSLMLAVATFGIGFLFRPLGAFTLGRYADRVGRRAALLLTITLLTLSTMAIGLTPSYATIGLAAPALMVLYRLVQGFALGGEFGPASAFLLEIAPRDARGRYSCWQAASQGVSAVVAGAVGFVTTTILSPSDLESWGWRIGFLFSALVLPPAIYLRSLMPETLVRAATPPRATTLSGAPICSLCLAAIVLMSGTVTIYVANFVVSYAIAILHFQPRTGFLAAIFGGSAMFVGSLFGGRLSDKFGRRHAMFWPRLTIAAIAWPLFLALQDSPTPLRLVLLITIIVGVASISIAASVVAISEMFVQSFRATGLAISYALSVAAFGAPTQYVVTYLIGATGDPTAPGWCVAITSAISAIACWLMPETRDRRLDG